MIEKRSKEPGPSAYKLEGTMLNKYQNPIVVKAARITEAFEIEKREKKRPSPATYKINPIWVSKKVPLGTVGKTERIGYLDNIAANATPWVPDIKYHLVSKKTTDIKYFKLLHPPKDPPKVNLSPASYRNMDAYKDS